jgi:DNA-binding MarR family transcriptional regulator
MSSSSVGGTWDGAPLGHELSLWAVLYHEAIAERLGLNATEHRLLDVIAHQPGVTPTQLADQSGLSQPAVTKVVNRLVDVSYAQRHRDDADGRKYQLTVTAAYQETLAGLYAPMAEAMNRLADELDESDRHAIARWLAATVDILRESTGAARRPRSSRQRSSRP